LKSARNLFRWVFILFLLIGWQVSPGSADVFDTVEELRLSNGMKVILLENHGSPVATFHLWYRAGARDEPFGKTGLAHLFEHMMFKGTEKVSGAEFNRILQEHGAQMNAFTSHDFTGFYETIGADRLDIPIELEADRMRNLVLREEDFETERKVVIEERRLRVEDDPQSLLGELVNAAAFQLQPYRRPVIGWMEDLNRIEYADLLDFYETYYQPANAFIVVVGDFKKEELIPKLNEKFGAIPPGEEPVKERYSDPAQSGERRITLVREASLPYLMHAFRVPNFNHPDSFALEVLAAVLSSGKSSRFHQSLVREKQLVLSANANHHLVGVDSGLFRIAAVPLPGRETAEVEKALEAELERLRSEPLEDAELEKAKNQIEAQFVFTQDSLFYQAMLLAWYEISGEWRKITEYIPSIRSVTPADIQRVAAQYLVPENRTTGILIPQKIEEKG
jgi:zinc protease